MLRLCLKVDSYDDRRNKRYASAEAGENGVGRGTQEVATRPSLLWCRRMYTRGVQTTIIVECKAITQLSEWEHYQTFGYLRATKFPIAILVNFGTERRAQIERYHYSNGKLYVFWNLHAAWVFGTFSELFSEKAAEWCCTPEIDKHPSIRLGVYSQADNRMLRYRSLRPCCRVFL